MSGLAENTKTFKRKLVGTVVSDKANKTIVVSVARRFKHPKYPKFINQTKKFHAHDEENRAKMGDKVTIIESRPYSLKKKWELLVIK